MWNPARAGWVSHLTRLRHSNFLDERVRSRRSRLHDQVKASGCQIKNFFFKDKKAMQRGLNAPTLRPVDPETATVAVCDVHDTSNNEEPSSVAVSQDVLNEEDLTKSPNSVVGAMIPKEEAYKLIHEPSKVIRSIPDDCCNTTVSSPSESQLLFGASKVPLDNSLPGQNASCPPLDDASMGEAAMDVRADKIRHPNLGKEIRYQSVDLSEMTQSIQFLDAREANDTECAQIFRKDIEDLGGISTDSNPESIPSINVATRTQRSAQYTYYAPFPSRTIREGNPDALSSKNVKECSRGRLASESTLVNSVHAKLPSHDHSIQAAQIKVDGEDFKGTELSTLDLLLWPHQKHHERRELVDEYAKDARLPTQSCGTAADEVHISQTHELPPAPSESTSAQSHISFVENQLREALREKQSIDDQCQLKDEQIKRLTSLYQGLQFRYDEQQAVHGRKFSELERLQGEQEQQIFGLRREADAITNNANMIIQQYVEYAAFHATNTGILQQEVARLLGEQRSPQGAISIPKSYSTPTVATTETQAVIEHVFELTTELENVKKAKEALEVEQNKYRQGADVTIHSNKEFAEQAEVTYNLSREYDRLERQSNVDRKLSEKIIQFYQEENKRLQDGHRELKAEMEQYKDYNAHILQTLKRRLVRDDVLQAIEHHYNIMQADNDFLVEKVQQQYPEISALHRTAIRSKTKVIEVEATLSECLRQVNEKLEVAESVQQVLELEKLGLEMELQVLQREYRDTVIVKDDEIGSLEIQLQEYVEREEAVVLGNTVRLMQIQLYNIGAEISQLKGKIKELQQDSSAWDEYEARQKKHYELECKAASGLGMDSDDYKCRLARAEAEKEELERQLGGYDELKYRDKKNLMTELNIIRKRFDDLLRASPSKSATTVETINQLRSLGRYLLERMNILERALREEGLCLEETGELTHTELWHVCEAHLGIELIANDISLPERSLQQPSPDIIEEHTLTSHSSFDTANIEAPMHPLSSESCEAEQEEDTITFGLQNVSRQSEPARFITRPAQERSEMVHPRFAAEQAKKQRFVAGGLVLEEEEPINTMPSWLSESPQKYTGKGKGRQGRRSRS